MPGRRPESPVLQRLLAEARDARPARRGHGGVVARPGPGAGGRDPLRRRGLHEPVPRPSRLPRDRWRPTSPPRRRCSRPSAPPWPWSTRTTRWGRRLLERPARPDGGVLDGRGERHRERAAAARRSRGAGGEVELALAGSFHVANALAAATTAAALGVPEDVVVAGLERGRPGARALRGGRHRRRRSPSSSTTPTPPKGCQVVLDSARQLAGGHRVLCVFGCGGDRDHEKRPAMGAIAAAAVPTSPWSRRTTRGTRTPTPSSTRSLAGVPDGVGGRSSDASGPRPSSSLIDLAAPGDVVVVAGKGHEREIEIGPTRVPVRRSPRWRGRRWPGRAAGGHRAPGTTP